MSNVNVRIEIEKLLLYAKDNKLIEEMDIVFARNQLLELFNEKEPLEDVNFDCSYENLNEILEKLNDRAFELGLIPENTVTYRDLFDTKVMGILMPRPSEVLRRFNDLKNNVSLEVATDAYYKMSIASNYIRKDRIEKNLYWKTETEYGELEITVNLSKPEKDPKAIALARKMKASNYPKCFLCYENVGYQGRINHPARQNHRVIPIELKDEQWYLQYSPYVYYNEHCIVFKGKHEPMKISKDTFIRLLDFESAMPHYFLGSNADLPIVGGSILSHDHFQGGNHTFPMAIAKREKVFKSEEFKNVSIGIVKWPMSVIRISSNDKEELISCACHIMDSWKKYNDKDCDISAFTDDVPHNTITPISRSNDKGEFELDLVLRNNRTSEEYPDGIFHPHQELHHIKKENIGLIEVMGLAVLPGRLKMELDMIKPYLTNEKKYIKEETKNDEVLAKHSDWIEKMMNELENPCTKEEAELLLQKEVGLIFSKVLEHAGVYKRNARGEEGFVRFMNNIGMKEIV